MAPLTDVDDPAPPRLFRRDPDDRPPPTERTPITAAGADRVTAVARLGLGMPEVLAFRSDGNDFAVGTSAGLIRILDPSTGEEIQRWAARRSAIRALQYQPDSARLVSGSADGAVVFWDPSDSQELDRFEGHDGAVMALAFSADASLLASASVDDTVVIWDVASGDRVHTLEGHRGVLDPLNGVNAVAFSPDGTVLASAGDDTNVILWDVASGAQLHKLKFGAHGAVLAVAFDPTGELLISAGHGTGLRVWDPASGEHLRQLRGGADSVHDLAFSPDGQLLASAGDRNVQLGRRNTQTTFGPLSIDDPREGKPVARLGGHAETVTSIAWSPDGATVASAGQDAAVRLWETAGWSERAEITAGFSRNVDQLAFHGDHDVLTVSRDTLSPGFFKDLTLWDLTTGRPRARTTVPNLARTFDVHPGRGLAALSGQGVTIHQWGTGDRLRSVTGEPVSPQRVVFSPDGSQLAIGGSLGGLTLSDPGTSEPAQQLEAHKERVHILAFSPDGTLLAAGGVDRVVTVWTTAPIELRATLETGTQIADLTFSHDGALLAIAKVTGEIEVWEPATGRRTWTTLGSAAGVTSLRFHPAAPLLASGARDGMLALWTVGTDVPIQSLARHAMPITSLAFNADGDLLASGGRDGAVWLWGIPADAATG